LRDVVALQLFEGLQRLAQAGRGHAPGANGGAHQVHGVVRAGQPLAEQEAVQPAEDQPLGAARGGGHHADVGRGQSMVLDVAARRRPA
jgi:hypothetical protein